MASLTTTIEIRLDAESLESLNAAAEAFGRLADEMAKARGGGEEEELDEAEEPPKPPAQIPTTWTT